jgi:hypothetical protein
MHVFEPAVIGCILYIFEVNNFKYKVYFKNESIYPFQTFKKIHLFLQSLVDSIFILFIFHSSFHTLDLFFSNSFAVLYKLELTEQVTVFSQMLFTFQSYSVV